MVVADMTPAQYQAKAAELKSEYGVTLEGESGEVTLHGVTGSYRYDGNKLVLEVLRTPFLVSKALAESFVRKFLAA